MNAANERAKEGLDEVIYSHSKQSLRLWLRMLRCTTLVEKTLRNRLTSEFGTTLPRFDVLAALYRESEGMTMSALSGHLLVSNGNVTGLVGRLQADSLVQREALAEDRRTFCVKLTAKGRRAFERMADNHENWIDGMFVELSDEEIGLLLDLLDRAHRSVQEAVSKETKNDA